MGIVVSIDNGGTLTDVCATDGATVVHAKTITTPHDLTECFVKGLEVLAEKLFGEADLARLVPKLDHVRYSTTQGTNAIVQRKGPRIGWLADDVELTKRVRTAAPGLFDAIVGDRIAFASSGAGDAALTRQIADLISRGANRVIVALSGKGAEPAERAAKRALYRAFPRHLLGAVPLLFSTELVKLGADERRVWSSIVNAFLHPAMEQFLYNAEGKMRAHRARKPLLIFRNDGNTTRVAKTVALKTYSSGPQGGVVGAEVLLRHYAIPRAVSIDVGGTTTDIALFEDGKAGAQSFGNVEGAPVAIPLSDVASIGVAGGSIMRVEGQALRVGPESAGSAPGPACFARGGTKATITDALLIEGILDPKSYLGGRMPLDTARARAAITKTIAEPLGLDLDGAVAAMIAAYDRQIAKALTEKGVRVGHLLLAFGGAGPMSACGIAHEAGLNRILIPRYAAVFSAFGISFSDIEHTYTQAIDDGSVAAAKAELQEQARRGMLAEGFELRDCALQWSALTAEAGGFRRLPLEVGNATPGTFLELKVVKAIEKARLGGAGMRASRRAAPSAIREGRRKLALFRMEDLKPGDWGEGPCLIEEAFFTAAVEPGWRFVVSDNNDLFLDRGATS